MSLHLLERSKAIQWESIVVLILGTYIIANLTWSDIIYHDSYVLPMVAECHAENTSNFCNERREEFGCEQHDQLCIGSRYWENQKFQVFFVGSLMFGFRMGIAIILHKKTVYKIRPFTVFMAVIYGIIGANLFMFGVLDTLYFVFQPDRDFPEKLDWLDQSGIFQETKKWFGDPNTVEYADLIATNILGIILIIGFIFVGMLMMAYSGSERAIA